LLRNIFEWKKRIECKMERDDLREKNSRGKKMPKTVLVRIYSVEDFLRGRRRNLLWDILI
jgi:hypothetical protein